MARESDRSSITFTQHFWSAFDRFVAHILVRLRVLLATLVASPSTELVPVVQVAPRLLVLRAQSSGRERFAAGILCCVFGVCLALSEAGVRFLADIIGRCKARRCLQHGGGFSVEVLRRVREAKRVIPVYGHPLH